MRRTFRNQKIQNMKNLYSNLQNIINLLNLETKIMTSLAKRLEAMNLIDPSTSKRQINILSGSETESSSNGKQTYISDNEDNQINRIKYQKTWHQRTRNFYPMPTPPNLQYEERFPKELCIMIPLFMNGILMVFLNMKSLMFYVKC